MNANQLKVFERLLAGIKFLADEADRSGFSYVGNLLRHCAKEAHASEYDQINCQSMNVTGNDNNHPKQ